MCISNGVFEGSENGREQQRPPLAIGSRGHENAESFLGRQPVFGFLLRWGGIWTFRALRHCPIGSAQGGLYVARWWVDSKARADQNAPPPPPPNPPPEKPPPPPPPNPEPPELERGAETNTWWALLAMECMELVKKMGLKAPG